MTPKYVMRDGSRLTPYMNHLIEKLDADFYKKFKLHILVTSGIRTHEEQTKEFLRVFRPQASGNGPFNDVRWWNGTRYVRWIAGGTVAQPGTSNHEIQGTRGAMDLRDSGDSPGITMHNNERSNWLKANASKYGLIAEGYNFDEPWHYEVANIFLSVPEDDMPLSNDDIKKIAKAVWEYQVATQDENGKVQKKTFPAWGFISSTNAQAQGSLKRTKEILNILTSLPEDLIALLTSKETDKK